LFLIGHSFGGQLAAKYASRHQEQIDKLILIGPAGVRDNSWPMQVKRAIFGLAAKIGKQIFKVLPGKESFRWLLYKLAREKDYYQAYPELRQTMANVIAEDIQKNLSSIEAETLLIWGMQDTASLFANSQIFNQEIVQSHLVSIPNARHSPQYTHSEQVSQIIISFLDQS
jgi:pimeloyl-ACP methyl ester carboxylesterase